MKRPDGSRGLYVDPSCRWTIAEYGSYQYPPVELAALAGMGDGADGQSLELNSRGNPQGGSGPLSELPLKANDHLMDATRYALHTHFAQVRATERTDGWIGRWLGVRPKWPRRRKVDVRG